MPVRRSRCWACVDRGKAIHQEAIKQVAIGHRVTQSMPQSFTERRQMAPRARRFGRCICHQREAPKNAYLLSVKLCGILCVTLCPMATCLIASWRACCEGHPRYATNSQPNERTTNTTTIDSLVFGRHLSDWMREGLRTQTAGFDPLRAFKLTDYPQARGDCFPSTSPGSQGRRNRLRPIAAHPPPAILAFFPRK
jgi:hypothetical protein